MDRHKVDAILGMHFEYVDPLPAGDVLERLIVIDDCIVNGHCTENRRTLRSQLAAEYARIAERA